MYGPSHKRLTVTTSWTYRWRKPLLYISWRREFRLFVDFLRPKGCGKFRLKSAYECIWFKLAWDPILMFSRNFYSAFLCLFYEPLLERTDLFCLLRDHCARTKPCLSICAHNQIFLNIVSIAKAFPQHIKVKHGPYITLKHILTVQKLHKSLVYCRFRREGILYA